MVTSELVGAVVFLALATVASPVALLGLRVLASVAAAPLVPTTSAVLPSLIADKKLDEANAALSKAGTAGCLIGTAVAGLMLATVGGSWVFVLNAVTFLVSACLILATKGDFRPARSQREHLAAGFSFLRGHPTLWPVTIAYGIIFLGVGITLPGEIVVATDFDTGSLGFAGLVFLWGVGMIFGATVGGCLSQPQKVLVLGFAAGVVGAGFVAVSVAPIFAVALLGMAIGGFGEGLWQPTQNTLIQQCTPDDVRSRVFAGSEAAMQGGIALGLLASGFTIDAGGASAAFGMAAGAAGIATMVLILLGLRQDASFHGHAGRRPVPPSPASPAGLATRT